MPFTKTGASNSCVSRFNKVTAHFLKLSQTPSEDEVIAAMPVLERFTTLIYKRTTNCFKANDTRRVLFVKDGRDIPPTQVALMEQTKRAAYIAG